MTSKIKVDNIENQCGGAVVTKCGATTTISGSIVKANNIQSSDSGNIISQSGTTITIGASGDTINLASGASQSGFGREGSVDWQTSIKTTGFTAVSGEGYFCNTTGGAFTLTLPASPSAGDIVALKDYANTFDTNNLTVGRNGSLIAGETENATISVEGQALTLVYADNTKGWLAVDAATDSDLPKPVFITATGGTITTVCTNFKVHTFTSPGTFTVTAGGGSLAKVDYMVVAGGGGGGGSQGGAWGGGAGGGAGGFRESSGAASGCYTASPLGSGVSALSVSVQGYPITVGGGGGAGPGPNGPSNGSGGTGSTSTFSTITSAGGGGGAGATPSKGPAPARDGGSGGGGSPGTPYSPGDGNTPPVSPPQGNNGGNGLNADPAYSLGSGGGATQVGVTAPGSSVGAVGGAGATTNIPSSPISKAGGGGSGAAQGNSAGSGGAGGGANGASGPGSGSSASANTGGGGGGGAGANTSPVNGGGGGSGMVVIRYRFQA